MESAALALGRLHLLRVDPGEDVLGALKEFLARTGLKQAAVLGGYGTLASWSLHWVKHNLLPSASEFARRAGGFEILAMNGLVVAGVPHVHLTLANREGAFGGHLEEGCRAYVLCEIYLAEIRGPALARRPTPVNIPGMGKGDVPRLIFG